MNMAGYTEVEIKLRVANLAAVRRRLALARARPTANGRVHEMNVLFDTPQGGFAKQGQLLRLRVERASGMVGKAGGAAKEHTVLTYKGPAIKNTSGGNGPRKRYKMREEVEVGVADPERLRLILEALGLRGWFRYEKYRTSFQLPATCRWAAGLHVELDETPIGNFLELEGPTQAIDRAAELLGYSPRDYITQSYLALFLGESRKQGTPATDMVFPPSKK